MEKEFDTQPSAVPLDGHQSEKKNPLTGLVEWLPSLAPVWCTDVQFLCYVPPQVTPTGEVTPEWIEALDIMNNDLSWLLLQSHQRFWCQVMYDQTLQMFLDTYVQSAPRYYDDEWPKLPVGVEETARELHRRVFVTFVRMSTPKETAIHYLSDEAYLSIIYDHYLFDVPKLMDLCVLYGRANQAALGTMLTSIFERQPKYIEDLANAAKGLVQILNKAADRCCELQGAMNTADLMDLILYISDIGSTLRAFLEVYPSGGPHLEAAGLIERLVHFYESTVPALQSAWHTHKRTVQRAEHLKKRFRHAKHDFSWIVNSLLHLCYLNHSNTTRKPSSSGNAFNDGFLHAASTILSEKSFLREFQKHFSLKDCVQEMQSNHPELDSTHFTFVLSALGEDDNVATGDTLSPLATLEELIQHVKDVLPELGDDFIKACLRKYKNDAEAVINHVLEGTLPPHVHQQGGSDPTAAGGSSQAKELSLVTQRANVHDGDSFDIFRRNDIDLSKVNIGKRYNPSSVAAVLSDKSHLKHTRDVYKNFEYESNNPDECLDEEGDREDYQRSYLCDQDMYNDEYDDTYDSHDVGVADSVTTDEVFAVKRLNEKGLFQRRFSSSEDEDEEEEEESSGNVGNKGMQPSTAARAPIILKRSTAQNPGQGFHKQSKGARREEWRADAQGSSVGRNASLQDYGVEMRGKSDGRKYERRNEGNYERGHEGKDERSDKIKYDRKNEGRYEKRDKERTDEVKFERRDERKVEERYEEGDREKLTGKQGDSDIGTRARKGHLNEGEQHKCGPSRLLQGVQRSTHSELSRDADPLESYEQRKASKEKTARSSAASITTHDTSASDPPTKRDKGEASQEQQDSQTRASDDARSRQWKERNKGHRANHNRKDLADRKRNKGMGGLF
eukprot:Em0006g1035a